MGFFGVARIRSAPSYMDDQASQGVDGHGMARLCCTPWKGKTAVTGALLKRLRKQTGASNYKSLQGDKPAFLRADHGNYPKTQTRPWFDAAGGVEDQVVIVRSFSLENQSILSDNGLSQPDTMN